MKMFIAILLALSVSGCATRVIPLMPIVQGDMPDRPYTAVADLNSQVFFGGLFDEGTPEEMCLDKMRQSAFDQRADALIFVRYGERGFDALLRRTLRCSGRAVRFNGR
jgi:hypothetical protein